MKNIQKLVAVACVAAISSVSALRTAQAAELQQASPADSSLGTDAMQLAQADTGGKKARHMPLVNVDAKGVILKGYDAVAYVDQGKPVKGKESISSTHNGATYLFATDEDKAEFEKNPDKYVPQYGGFCAYSMMRHRIADIDPNVFFVYKGKLYVCTNQKGLEVFKKDPDVNIKKADDNWQLYELPESPGFRRYIGG